MKPPSKPPPRVGASPALLEMLAAATPEQVEQVEQAIVIAAKLLVCRADRRAAPRLDASDANATKRAAVGQVNPSVESRAPTDPEGI